MGQLVDPRLDEISGAVASARTPDTLWVHNDSGDVARVFAIGVNGAVKAEVRVRGAEAIDWEDISMGPGPLGSDPHVPWLYVGDMGDNRLRRPTVQIYRFPEPTLATGAETTIDVDAQRIDLRYPDGAPRNVEAMLVDPRTGELVIFTKRMDASEVFVAPAAALAPGVPVTLRAASTIPTGPRVTGADISQDGATIVVREYERAHVWHRAPNETVLDALSRPPATVAAPFSESIALLPGNAGWISIAEGAGAPILRGTLPSVPVPQPVR